MINGKNILYIGNKYHGYYKNIINSLKNYGAKVDFFPNKPKLNITYLKKFNTKICNYYVNYYFKSILNSINNKLYDYVLFMNGEDIHENLVKELKKQQNSAHFIMYQWDTVRLNKYQNYVNQFDVVFSFDRKDCENYGLKYLPLFYLDEFGNIENRDYDIDLLFIGTEHHGRLRLCLEISKIVKDYGLNFYSYLYIPFFVWLKKYFVDKIYSLYDIKYLNFNRLKLENVIDFFKRSRVILDIHGDTQTGLTMRTMEAIGSGKKIITTNPNIKYEEFFDPDIIQVIDKNNLKIDRNFILNDVTYSNSLIEIVKKYSLTNWIKLLFIN